MYFYVFSGFISNITQLLLRGRCVEIDAFITREQVNKNTYILKCTK